MQEGGKKTSNQWTSASSGRLGWFEEDDGGWKEGPPATGSGWTDPSPAANDRGQNIGTWQGLPSKDCDWSQSSSVNSVIVDSSDKEAWPSIGNSETAGSDAGDDNASVKSGSVISSSSSHGQNQETNQGISAMQSQSASNPWGANSTLGGIESNPWGIPDPPNSSAANMNPNMSWGSSNPHPSLSMNNQGHNMQVGTSIAGSDNLSNSMNSNPSTTRSGWGVGAPGQGSPRPQNSMQMQTSNGNNMHGLMVSSGAQQSGPPVSGNQSGPSNNQSTWQGSGAGMFGMGGYSKAQSQESGWNTPTSAVMNNGGKTNSGNNGGHDLDTGSSMWGSPEVASKSGFSGSGWGEPPPSTPQSAPQWDNNSKSQWGDNPNGAANSQGSGNNTELISWAQAACKGLNTGSSNSGSGQPSAAEAAAQSGNPKDDAIRMAIENHDGWGAKPVKQDTAWDVQESPKTKRKFSTDSGGGASNVWNNNNGTAIWEASRDNNSGGGNGNGGGSWNGASGGSQWQNENDSNTWMNPAGKPGADNQWVGSGGGSDKTIGTWGGGSESSASSMWGNKTETGSWGQAGQDRERGSQWGDGHPQDSSGFDENGRRRNIDGTGYWGEPRIQRPQAWNSTPSTPATPLTPKPEEPWNKVPPQAVAVAVAVPPSQPVQPVQGGAAPPPQKGSGWGDPNSSSMKVDDGTSIWAANAQQQARAGGWGDPGSQWNPTPGAKPKSLSTSSWAGDNGGAVDPSWNMRKPGWPDDNSASNSGNVWGGDTEVGYWNDISQESSTWSSAPGWKTKKNLVKGPSKFPTGSNNHPQMRSKLLQQLMDMGFKKEEAQNALISNNMNVESALADLVNGANKKDQDDVFMSNGAKHRMQGMMPDNAIVNEDISDTHSESNPHVPNINMQNTPFQNAQVPNQPFVTMYDRSKAGPSLPPSSLNPNNPSINPQSLQQKLMQHKRQQQQQNQSMNSMSPTQGPLTRGQLPNTQQVMQQQMAQQQILQQLRLAVQSGLISPQLLNQQLPHNILVLLQQLLQLQNVLQQLVTKQQFLQQNKMMNMMQRQQVDQLAVMINNIKQQILQLQKQLSQAQQILLKNPSGAGGAGAGGPLAQNPSAGPLVPDSVDPIMPIQSELEKLTMNPPQVQQTSRLTQWKRPTPDKETAAAVGEGENLNKAVGSKPLHQSQSGPTLGPFSDLSGLNISGDTTWSTQATTSSQNWPSNNTSGTTSQAETKDIGDMKESHLSATTSCSTPTISMTDIIPEFVPGKPWQGLARNVEDDPHITPGSISRSLSVNVVKDDYLNNLATNIKTSPADSSTTWSMKGSHISTTSSKNWSTSDNAPPGACMGDVWRMPSNKRPPPGLMGQMGQIGQMGQKSHWPAGVNRQNSWAGTTDNSAFTPVNQGWDGRAHNASTWLVLRNLTPQTDGSTLRTLCQQHGPLRLFYLSLSQGQALVGYSSKDEAVKAQKALNTCVLGNTTILADFVSDQEAAQFVDQHNNMSSSNNPSQWSQSPQSNFQPSQQGPGQPGAGQIRSMQQPPPNASLGSGNMVFNRSSSESTPWSAMPPSQGGYNGGGRGPTGANTWSTNLWERGGGEDHNSNPFLSNI